MTQSKVITKRPKEGGGGKRGGVGGGGGGPIAIADLVTFNDEILNRKLHFLCSGAIPAFSFTI